MTSSAPISPLIAKTAIDARIAEMIAPTTAALGYALVRVRVMGAGGRGGSVTLQIMAERPDGSMEIDDCAALSHALSALLDVEDPIDGEYALEVSSPGIDRPLTRAKDFSDYLGHTVRIELGTGIGGRRRWRGVLRGFDAESNEIDVVPDDAPAVKLPFDDLVDARLILTDALIEESLRRNRAPSADFADDVDIEETEDDGDAEGDDDEETQADGAAAPHNARNTEN